MNVLSLFDGMACGMLAMQSAGVSVYRYVAFEIDKYAVQTSSHNFPMIEHRGNVFDADFREFQGFDLLCGGSPCTYWSIAQKNNRETEASGMGWELFRQYVRALHEAKPRFFVYENNKSMSNAIRESITQTFGFEPICINSALVSAQNRQRLYWVGKRNPDGTYRQVKVEQPEDRHILLRDVLDGITDREKAWCVLSSIGRTTTREYFKKDQGTMAFEPTRIPSYNNDEKSRPLSASYSHKGCGEGSLDFDCFPKNPNKQVFDYVAESVFCAKPCEWDDLGNPTKATSSVDGKTYPVFDIKNEKIKIKDRLCNVKLCDGYYIVRKLTVLECMRLQTVQEWYRFPVSDSQAYKMLGNGWTVEVISHILSFMDF